MKASFQASFAEIGICGSKVFAAGICDEKGCGAVVLEEIWRQWEKSLFNNCVDKPSEVLCRLDNSVDDGSLLLLFTANRREFRFPECL